MYNNYDKEAKNERLERISYLMTKVVRPKELTAHEQHEIFVILDDVMQDIKSQLFWEQQEEYKKRRQEKNQ